MISQQAAAIDLYSASAELLATTDCFFDFQLTKESPMKTQYPVIDFLVFGHPAQSLFEYLDILKSNFDFIKIP